MNIPKVNSIIESESYYINRAMNRFGLTRNEYNKKYEYYLNVKDNILFNKVKITLSDPDKHEYPKSMVIYLLILNINYYNTEKNKHGFNINYIETGYDRITYTGNIPIWSPNVLFKPSSILCIKDLVDYAISHGLISEFEYYYKNDPGIRGFFSTDKILHNVLLYKNMDIKYMKAILMIKYHNNTEMITYLRGLNNIKDILNVKYNDSKLDSVITSIELKLEYAIYLLKKMIK